MTPIDSQIVISTRGGSLRSFQEFPKIRQGLVISNFKHKKYYTTQYSVGVYMEVESKIPLDPHTKDYLSNNNNSDKNHTNISLYVLKMDVIVYAGFVKGKQFVPAVSTPHNT